jgi:hypothetical protein
MSAAMVISAIEQAMLLAETEGTEALAHRVQQLEGEIGAILAIIDIALAAFSTDDPLRADLEEMRSAAVLAVSKAGMLAQRAAVKHQLRAI